jgi:threonyl-tRNA synthetase
MKKRGVETYIDGKGEAAIYGPKIDFIAKDSIGRTQQIATIQLDFIQPQNFDLTCTNEKGEKEQVVMIHCAIMGSIERFLSVMIEHLAGNFPLWLAPVQVAVVPISDAHLPFAQDVVTALKSSDIRTKLYGESDSLGKKIRDAKVAKIPYTLVIGDAEVAAKEVTLESRDHGKIGSIAVSALLEKFEKEIKERAM